MLSGMVRSALAVVLASLAALAQGETAPSAPAPAAAAAAPAAGTSGHAVVLKDGTRIECAEAPLVALGRVLYKTADGTRHALPVDRVDLDKTRPAQRAASPPPSVAARQAQGSAGSLPPATSAAQRRMAPDFEARKSDGSTLKLSQLKGKVVLVDFWATWCGPCVMEMPHVKKIYEKHAGPQFEIVGVSLDRRQSDLDAFLKAQGIKWPQSFDGKGWENAVAQKYGVGSIPTMMLVDRAGRIARVGLRGPSLEAAITELIAEPAGDASQTATPAPSGAAPKAG